MTFRKRRKYTRRKKYRSMKEKKKHTRKRQTRKKQKRKRKQKRGGMRRIMTDADINTFITPHQFPRDCSPCVFRLLRITDDQETQHLKNLTGQIGFERCDFKNLFINKFPDYYYRLAEYVLEPELWGNMKNLNALFKNIPNGTAAVGIIESWNKDGSRANKSHCVSFAKYSNGTPVIFDAQLQQQHVGDEAIEAYLKTHELNKIFIINSYNKTNNNQLILNSQGEDTNKNIDQAPMELGE